MGGLEEKAKAVLDYIDEERNLPPSGTDERDTLALYMGLQLARDPDHVLRFEFAHDAIEAIGHLPIDRDSMKDYLTEQVLGFEPHDTELQVRVGSGPPVVNVEGPSPHA